MKNKACIIAHSQIPNCFYCSSKKGFTGRINEATKYIDEKARMAGLQEIYDTFPKANCQQLIFHFI